MLFYQAMNADTLELGGQNQYLVRLEGMPFVDHLQHLFQCCFELGIVADGRRAQASVRDSAASCICSGSKS